ncbi:nucleoporin NUP35-like isoform X1 [Macrosteles quadrilineatus]|uniref:nucleoporin NUP35-like isoform X1 n=1 Tax=Macrosteles quadrilineatus TaxID=74068 RepID=UPI0023E2ADED|nr:nucleoporin NUP35-like isoform X1 [Macrosteles quadrilineatus]
MEPMTLGSPVGSPGTQNPSSPFLPGFLMGDPAPQPTSPTKTPRQVHFAPTTAGLSATSPLTPGPIGPTSLNESFSRFHKNQREKSGGPPTVGLFDTLDVTASALPPSTPTTPYEPSAQLMHTPQQSTNQSSAEEGERWVTVFGFPPAAASSVLGQFSQVGHIIEHRFPGQGNWVNICYASKLDARRALSYNGKVLSGHTMIGVVPCRDYINYSMRRPVVPRYSMNNRQTFLRRCPCTTQQGSALKDMTNMFSSTATPTTPKSPQMTRLSQRRLVTSPTSPYAPSPRGGRPLNMTAQTENEVHGSQNTPTKSTSFVTKAVDYVFGW